MSANTLFLAWQDQRKESRLWFPVGRLDVAGGSPRYRFRYIGGAKRAEREAGFPPLVEFPRLMKTIGPRSYFHYSRTGL